MKQFLGTLGVVVAFVASASLVSAQILKNGGFEQNDGVTLTADFNVDGTADSVLVKPGQTHITSVEVATDPDRGVYYLNRTLGPTNNPEGDYFVWLSGAPADCVLFDLVNSGVNTPLVNGTTYEVSFWAAAFDVTMDANYVPTGIPAQTDSPFTIELQRIDASLLLLDTVLAPASTSYANMNWVKYAYQFSYDNTNPSTNYSNLILSTTTNNEGIAFDDVRLTIVPEPGVLGLCLLTIVGLALRRRRAA